MSLPSGGSKTSRRAGRDRRNEPVQVRLSKTLSYILRHGAVKEGLAIRPDGYVSVADLLARPKLKELDLPGLLKIVQADQKQRYQLGARFSSSDERIVPIEISDNSEVPTPLWIRANQGHTLQVDGLELNVVTDPADIPCAVHGTTSKAWENIKSQGLSRMQRNHIHLASGRPGESGIISGMRASSQILVFIDVPAAMAAGITFQVSANGVILTSGDSSGFIPPHFFAAVERRRGSEWEPVSLLVKAPSLGTGEDRVVDT